MATWFSSIHVPLLKLAFALAAVILVTAPSDSLAHEEKPNTQQSMAKEVGSPSGDVTSVTVNVDLNATVAEVVTVPLGARISLTILGAGANELHLHGYDVTAQAKPGQPVFIAFDANHSGRFPIQVHVEDELLGTREKAMLYIEVRDP